MILLIGQVGTGHKYREAFQEIDYRAFYGTVAKWVVEIDSVDRIPELISRAWSSALSGRPGPVVVALPENMLTAHSTAVPCRAVTIAEPAPSAAIVNQIQQLLRAARRPLVLIGGGGWQSAGRQALQHFVEHNNLPVVAAFRYQDLIDNCSSCYVGDAGAGMWPTMKSLIREADVILAIGVRFGEMTTDAYSLLEVPHATTTLIHVHASDRELGKIYAPELPVHAGPNTTSEALAKLTLDGGWSTWRKQAREAYQAGLLAPVQPGEVDIARIITWLQENLPADSILTNGAGNFALWPNKFFSFGAEQRLLAPQSGAMGYGLPAAIAAKIARPERTVVCFTGDGDFQMTCAELGTAMQAQAQPIILILNNGSYGTIRMHQERHYPARVSGTDLMNPDFSALARAYGFHAEEVNETAEFPAAFRRAQASSNGAVLDLKISVEALTARQTLSEIRAAGTREKRRQPDMQH
jgi:acetolactate synthase-1/2/3 large subunit